METFIYGTSEKWPLGVCAGCRQIQSGLQRGNYDSLSSLIERCGGKRGRNYVLVKQSYMAVSRLIFWDVQVVPVGFSD